MPPLPAPGTLARISCRSCWVLPCIVFLPSLCFAATVTSTWNNGSGNWTNGAMWSPSGAPNNNATTTFDAVIRNGTVVLNQPVTVNKLTVSFTGITLPYSPYLNGTATLTTNDLFFWDHGTLGDGGVINVNGGMTLGTFHHITENYKTLNLNSNTTWAGAYQMPAFNYATINNAAGATFTATTDSNLAGGTFNNNGTVSKTAGSGVSYISSDFISGPGAQVIAKSGRLNLIGGTGAGTFTVDAGAALGFGDTSPHFAGKSFTFASTASLSGAGTVKVIGTTGINPGYGGVQFLGRYNVTGATDVDGHLVFGPGAVIENLGDVTVRHYGRLTFNTGTTQTLSSLANGANGVMTVNAIDGPDELIINGPLNWGGWFRGTGSITLNGTTTAADRCMLMNAVMNNNGNFTSVGGGSQDGGGWQMDGATFNNNVGGTVTFAPNPSQSSARIGRVVNPAAPSTFNNAGAFIKQGNYSLFVDIMFNNSGSVDVQSHGVTFRNSTNTSGPITVQEFASVSFGAPGSALPAPTHNFSSSSSVSGRGSVGFLFGNVSFAGDYSAIGNSFVGSRVEFTDGANVNLTAGRLAVGNDGQVVFNTGKVVQLHDVNVNGVVSGVDRLIIRGELSGSGTISNGIVNQGHLSPGSSPGILSFTNSLVLEDTSSALFELAGRNQSPTSSDFDVVRSSGELALGGRLELAFSGGFASAVTPADQFVIITTNASLSGQFANVANGQRLGTTDGLGSFLVYYGPDSPFGPTQVVLTDFSSQIPEPAITSLLATLRLLAHRRRRSHRI